MSADGKWTMKQYKKISFLILRRALLLYRSNRSNKKTHKFLSKVYQSRIMQLQAASTYGWKWARQLGSISRDGHKAGHHTINPILQHFFLCQLSKCTGC